MLVILAASAVWGQSSPRPMGARPRAVMATSNGNGIAAAAGARAAANQRLEEMGETLTKMHMLLKRMHANSGKDSMAKANADMWTLMVEQLDKQYEQLRLAERQREDLEARRAALYKQADERAAEEVRKMREAGRAAAPNAATQDGSQPAATQAPHDAQTPSSSPQ